MTMYKYALSELSSRLIGTGSNLTNSLSEILAVALQELIEAELTAAIGARLVSELRTAWRNATGTARSC